MTQYPFFCLEGQLGIELFSSPLGLGTVEVDDAMGELPKVILLGYEPLVV